LTFDKKLVGYLNDMKFINLTPHDVTVINNNNKRTFHRDGTIARVSQISPTVVEVVDGVTISVVRFGDVVGLPQPVDGVKFIVSVLVKSACPNRTDLVSPGDQIRDENGNVIGCKQFFC
jgi:hypothetical protein